MDYFKSWILSICGATVLISIVCALIPKTSTSRIVRISGTVILVFAVLSPLKKLHPEDLYRDFQVKQVDSVDAIEAENKRFEIAVIEERLSEYILHRAKQLGIECEVNVHVRKSENGMLLPHSIELFSTGDTSELERLIEEECGVTPIVDRMRAV